MRHFKGIVTWYAADRITGMLAWSSNISIIFIVNSKIALVFETEMLNWTEWRITAESRLVFHLEPLSGFDSDFVYAKFSEINVIIRPSCYFHRQVYT